MSHELRTPLNAIIGFTDLMLTEMPGALVEKQKDYLKRVIANGERLLALINDVLDLAKIESARVDIVAVAFSPAELLKATENQLRGLADQKKLRFDTQLAPDLPLQLKGDANRLEQILVNLVGNAIRFTDVGNVSVRFAKSDDTHWILEVADTGVGIPPHAQEFIFDEFRQVDGSPQRMHGGTGLGLAIVRKLAQAMGGAVRVESEVGKGSVFTVQLPLVDVQRPITEAQGI